MKTAAQISKLQRGVSVGLLVLVLIWGAFSILAPGFAGLADTREAIAAERDRLGALQEKRRDIAALEAALRSYKAASAKRALVLEATTTAAAWEKLEQAVRDTANSSSASIVTSRPLRMEDEVGLKAMRLDVTLRVPRAQFSEFVAALEDRAPALFFEQVRAKASSDAGETGAIEIAATIRALAVIGGQPAVRR